MIPSWSGNHAGDLIDPGQGNPQRPSDILDRGPGLHGAKGADLGHAFLAIFFFHVTNDLAAPLLAKIDVDIGSFQSVLIEESFEQQSVLDRTNVAEVKRITNDCTNPAATGGGRNIPFASLIDEIPANQKVVGKSKLS